MIGHFIRKSGVEHKIKEVRTIKLLPWFKVWLLLSQWNCIEWQVYGFFNPNEISQMTEVNCLYTSCYNCYEALFVLFKQEVKPLNSSFANGFWTLPTVIFFGSASDRCASQAYGWQLAVQTPEFLMLHKLTYPPTACHTVWYSFPQKFRPFLREETFLLFQSYTNASAAGSDDLLSTPLKTKQSIFGCYEWALKTNPFSPALFQFHKDLQQFSSSNKTGIFYWSNFSIAINSLVLKLTENAVPQAPASIPYLL